MNCSTPTTSWINCVPAVGVLLRVLAVLPGLFMSTGLAEAAEPPLSRAQSLALAREIVLHTPEHLHFASGSHFSWVLLGANPADRFPEVTREVRALLAERYTIYESAGEVPADKVRRDEYGTSYVSGFRFEFSIGRPDKGSIQVTYSDYESPLAGSSQSIRYRWKRGAWLTVGSPEPLMVW